MASASSAPAHHQQQQQRTELCRLANQGRLGVAHHKAVREELVAVAGRYPLPQQPPLVTRLISLTWDPTHPLGPDAQRMVASVVTGRAGITAPDALRRPATDTGPAPMELD